MKFVFDAIQVVISQMNGKDHSSHSTHSFNVGRMRIKLCRGWITKAREIYSPTMQVQFRQSTIILVSRTHAHACACTRVFTLTVSIFFHIQNYSFLFFISMDNLDKE